jgi:hypothetical protein
MGNIPVNKEGQILLAGQSATGSYAGFSVCAISGSINGTLNANFTGLKEGSGGSLVSGSIISFAPGTFIPLTITSASLDVNSAPVLLYR